MGKLVITEIPLKYFYYFQYLIYGFNLQAKNGQIDFKIKPSTLSDWVFFRFYMLYRILIKYCKYFREKEKNSYLMKGYYWENEKIIHFCYDIADSPHYYDLETLKSVNLYFKAQCPIEFKKTGFELTPEAILPYTPGIFSYIGKIYPSMLGPGFRVNNIFSYYKLNKGYKGMFLSEMEKDKSLMCYFGNSLGNKEVYSENPNLYTRESHILGFFKDKVTHPNVKRGIAAKLISEILPDSDARVIHEGNCDFGNRPGQNHLFISLKDFPQHISRFKYNLNISGHRLSIPYRFIHSFTVGTAIITDKLKLKWYLPFGPEVHETVEMGYLPVEQVNWDGFKQDLINLPRVDSNQILDEFYKKWSPEAFAGYIINTCKKQI